MRRGEHELLLRGVVELDESLLGGRERGRGKCGCAAQRKTLVAVLAAQTPEGGLGRAHLQSYLDEFCYRLDRRDARLDLFRRILDRCVLHTPPTTYSQLIAA
jgi:hypothetical protein